jgi:hypothetical protein
MYTYNFRNFTSAEILQYQIVSLQRMHTVNNQGLNRSKSCILTMGKLRRDVALTGIVGKIGPTTSPTIDTNALLEP